MAEEINIRKLFLTSFTKQLVIEAKDHLHHSYLPKIEIINEPTTIPSTFQNSQIPSIMKTTPHNPTSPPELRRINIPLMNKPLQRIGQRNNNLKPSPKKVPLIRPKPGYIDLGKLNFLVADPWVQAIECQGPERKITVKKGNKTLLTDIVLSEDEINKIVDEFSLETKIPLINGTLKAAHNTLMITAIISDIVGGRFVIEKTNPENLQI